MTKSDLLIESTLPEFWLAMHVRNATLATQYARQGWRDMARDSGATARRWLARYADSK